MYAFGFGEHIYKLILTSKITNFNRNIFTQVTPLNTPILPF